MRPLVLLAVLAAAAAAGPAAAAPHRDATPVIARQAPRLGLILSTRRHLALYTWRKEAKGTVRCTGACARSWPPLLVPKGTMVAKHVAHVMGTFGTIRRPDGRTQVTIDGHPLYTFAGDSPTKILCNGVDGWFVRKA